MIFHCGKLEIYKFRAICILNILPLLYARGFWLKFCTIEPLTILLIMIVTRVKKKNTKAFDKLSYSKFNPVLIFLLLSQEESFAAVN